mgnify:CR=1 FL=1
MEIYTIGVYNSTEKEFFNKLTSNQIDTFCDIRQRRGVRGSKYAFVNSNRLQQKLIDLDIRYGYIQGLAPTSDIRSLQKEIDLEKGELKSERHELGKIFIIEYKNRILQKFNFELFFEQLENAGANKIVLFCVEEYAEACHRSIVTNWIKDKYNLSVTHL